MNYETYFAMTFNRWEIRNNYLMFSQSIEKCLFYFIQIYILYHLKWMPIFAVSLLLKSFKRFQNIHKAQHSVINNLKWSPR